MVPDIVLASASPRRTELLAQLGVCCERLPVDIDEAPKTAELPATYVSRLAREKAEAALARLPSQWSALPVLGADTIVELDGELLGKPVDRRHAHEMLTRLSATSHHVHTAVALICHGSIHQCLHRSRVEFGQLDDAMIRRYLDTGEPLDKAGAYGIQGGAAAFIRHLEGSFSSVMGLPLYETAQLLRQCGIDVISKQTSETA